MDASSQRRRTAIDRMIDAFDAGNRVRDESRARLEAYVNLLARFGAHTDLVGVHDDERLVEIALADAFALLRHAEWLAPPWCEVGAGGASLSVPMACVLEGARGTMYEPRQKRATFLRLALGHLALHDRLRVEQSRVEPKRPPPSRFATAFARAVLPPPEWIDLAQRLLEPAGRVIVLSTAPLVDARGLHVLAADTYELPFTHAARVATWLAALEPTHSS